MKKSDVVIYSEEEQYWRTIVQNLETEIEGSTKTLRWANACLKMAKGNLKLAQK